MYEHLLLPIDGSPGTDAAAEQAFAFAQRYGARLDVLYVVDSSVMPLDSHSQTVFQELETEGRRALDELVDAAEQRGLENVTGTVLRGAPHQVILDYVSNNDVDLVVMGTHGRTGLEHFVLGSVTERVLRLSEAPVLTVPLAESDVTAEGTETERPDDEPE
jgi:nucleotide-binding universal stress UspA family protein